MVLPWERLALPFSSPMIESMNSVLWINVTYHVKSSVKMCPFKKQISPQILFIAEEPLIDD